VVGGCRTEKMRQVLLESTHGSEDSRESSQSQGTADECLVRKEKERKEITEEGMDGTRPGTNLVSSTQWHNAGCCCLRGLCLLLLLPTPV